MDSNFSDAERAVAYVTSGLTAAFPEGEVEILVFRGKHVVPRHMLLPVGQVRPILERLCHDFRDVSVCFRPEHAYGLVATLESHPEMMAGAHKVKHSDDHARVVILLRRNGAKEILVGTCSKPPVEHHDSLQVSRYGESLASTPDSPTLG